MHITHVIIIYFVVTNIDILVDCSSENHTFRVPINLLEYYTNRSYKAQCAKKRQIWMCELGWYTYLYSQVCMYVCICTYNFDHKFTYVIFNV